MRYARSAGLLVLLDAKRGDIGSTSRGVRRGVPRARRRRCARSRTPSRPARTSATTRSSRSSPRAGVTDAGSSCSSARRTPAPPTSRTQRSRTVGRSGSTSRTSSASGGSRSSASRACRASARSSARLIPRAVSEARRLLPQLPAAPSRRRRAGRDARRRRARVHDGRGERARHRIAIRHLRVSRHESRLAGSSGPGSAAARSAGLGGGRLVSHGRAPTRLEYSVAPVMRRALLAVVALVAVFAAPVQASTVDASRSPTHRASTPSAWYLVGDDGAVLAAQNEREQRAIASITKLMTALVVTRARAALRRRARDPVARPGRSSRRSISAPARS